MSPTNHCKKRLKEIVLEEDNSCESGASSGPHCQTRLPYWPQVSSMLSSAHLHLSLIGLSCPQWVAWEQAGQIGILRFFCRVNGLEIGEEEGERGGPSQNSIEFLLERFLSQHRHSSGERPLRLVRNSAKARQSRV